MDVTEVCDGADLAGASCESLGYASGTLACRDDCTLDLSRCELCDRGQRTLACVRTGFRRFVLGAAGDELLVAESTYRGVRVTTLDSDLSPIAEAEVGRHGDVASVARWGGSGAVVAVLMGVTIVLVGARERSQPLHTVGMVPGPRATLVPGLSGRPLLITLPSNDFGGSREDYEQVRADVVSEEGLVGGARPFPDCTGSAPAGAATGDGYLLALRLKCKGDSTEMLGVVRIDLDGTVHEAWREPAPLLAHPALVWMGDHALLLVTHGEEEVSFRGKYLRWLLTATRLDAEGQQRGRSRSTVLDPSVSRQHGPAVRAGGEAWLMLGSDHIAEIDAGGAVKGLSYVGLRRRATSLAYAHPRDPWERMVALGDEGVLGFYFEEARATTWFSYEPRVALVRLTLAPSAR
jgi:hypothetical protein